MATTYASASEVLRELEGIDATSIAVISNLTSQVTNLLPFTKLQLENLCGRDFEAHVGDAVYLDGQGSNILLLRKQWPITALTKIESVSSDGATFTLVAASGYKVDLDKGIVYRVSSSDRESAYEDKTDVWFVGRRNYRVTLSWGYATPPADVKMAQAHMVRAMILGRIAAADKSAEGSVQRHQVSTWSVYFASGSPYAGEIESSMALVDSVVQQRRVVGM